jgi:hypothetical protein
MSVSSRRDRELAEAEELYEGFREERPRRARVVHARFPRALAEIGVVEFLGYFTTHKGELALYIHEFAPGSRPRLWAGKRKGELYLFGGRFRVTERGITDLDRSGREISSRRRYHVKRVA